jgi:hypothetical protein
MKDKDLVVLVADNDMEQTVDALLKKRSEALSLKTGIEFDVFIHPQHDPGVFHNAHEFLRPLQGQYRYALVMLDREGSGQESKSAEAIERAIQERLDRVGWNNRSAVIVLDPELEVWVFSQSPHVIQVIAGGDRDLYQQVLNTDGMSKTGKPARPKEAMEEMLRRKRIPRSSGLYRELAEQVSLEKGKCDDRAFKIFCEILQGWFGS